MQTFFRKTSHSINKKVNHRYSTANRSLYRHMVCCVPVTCKANRVGNHIGAWRYSDLLAMLYLLSNKISQL